MKRRWLRYALAVLLCLFTVGGAAIALSYSPGSYDSQEGSTWTGATAVTGTASVGEWSPPTATGAPTPPGGTAAPSDVNGPLPGFPSAPAPAGSPDANVPSGGQAGYGPPGGYPTPATGTVDAEAGGTSGGAAVTTGLGAYGYAWSVSFSWDSSSLQSGIQARCGELWGVMGNLSTVYPFSAVSQMSGWVTSIKGAGTSVVPSVAVSTGVSGADFTISLPSSITSLAGAVKAMLGVLWWVVGTYGVFKWFFGFAG